MDYKKVLLLHFTQGLSGRSIAEVTCYSSNFLSDCYRRCLSGNYRCIMSMIFNERKKRAFPFMVSCANTVPGMLLTVTSWLLYNPTSLNASPVLRKLFREEQGNCALSLLR